MDPFTPPPDSEHRNRQAERLSLDDPIIGGVAAYFAGSLVLFALFCVFAFAMWLVGIE